MEILLLIISLITEGCKHLMFHSLIIICHSLCNMIWLTWCPIDGTFHYNDVIMSAIASQITSLTNVYSTVYSDTDQRKPQSSASLTFVWGIHRGPVNSPHKWSVTQKMFPFDDVIMWYALLTRVSHKSCTCCFVVNNMMAVNAEATMTIWLRQVRLKHGNVSRITLPLCGESTGLQWIPLTNCE